MEMCGNRCQPAHFRIRKDCLIFLHSNDHNRPGIAPLRPGGGGLASTFKPRLKLRKGLPLMLEMVPVVGGLLGVNVTPR